MSIRGTFLGVLAATLALSALPPAHASAGATVTAAPAGASASGGASTPADASTPAGASGRTDASGGRAWGAPVLVENFNGSRVDGRRWVVYHSPGAETNPRTGRASTVSGGALRLKGGFYGGKDLSGGIATRTAQRYGRWEVRLRAERGAGYTPVALLWPSDQDGGEYAEVDFAEIIDPSRRSGGIFVHRGERPQAQRQMRADFTRWHTVAVDWLPGRLTFWLDGRKVWDYRGPNVPGNRPMHLTLQNDVTCNRWSPCRNRSTPATVSMYVDWVKIYRADL